MLRILHSCVFRLFMIFFIYNIYADECEITECTFNVNSQWHKLLTLQDCPNGIKICGVKISWEICSDKITSPFGTVDQKGVTMVDGFVKRMNIVKSMKNGNTTSHTIELTDDNKIAIFSTYRNANWYDLIKPQNSVAENCSTTVKNATVSG
jgi:hypothetical protein